VPILLLILLIIAFLAAGLLTILVVVVLAIHAEDRRRSLNCQPRNRAQSATRRVLNVGVRVPESIEPCSHREGW
jgi:hypothetical protein